MTVPELFARAVYRRPEAPAVIWDGAQLSWAGYGRSVREVALGLISEGVRPGDRVAVAGEATPTARIADLAVISVGAISSIGHQRDDVFKDLDGLRAAGAELDEREPDRYERVSRAVEPGDPATAIADATLSHGNLVWTIRSLER